MAAITSYLALKSAVQQWMNRSDNTAINAIPLCIHFAEQDFQRTIRLPTMEEVMSFVSSSGRTDFDIPSDYFEAKHLSVNGVNYSRVGQETFDRIKNKPVESAPLQGDRSVLGNTNPNHFFTRVKGQFLVYPELKDGDTVQLTYWKDFEPMENETDYPESLKYGPDVMLYLALRHASIFLRDNDQAQFWEQKAEQSGTRLLIRLDEIEWSGSSIVDYLPAAKV